MAGWGFKSGKGVRTVECLVTERGSRILSTRRLEQCEDHSVGHLGVVVGFMPDSPGMGAGLSTS